MVANWTMSRDNWNTQFSQWSSSPSKSERQRCDNAISIVRNAIARHDGLAMRNTVVFVQGSYRNRVNVRQDSDVDIGVLCDQTFFYDLPSNLTADDLAIQPATYHYSDFKEDLTDALTNYLSDGSVERGNKAIKLRETTYHVDADVVPLFEHRQYFADRGVRYGVSLVPDTGPRIDNYPERLLSHWPEEPQHYENGVAKNKATQRCFKSIVRIIKKLRNAMDEAGTEAARAVPSYLIECLVWNVPNKHFGGPDWYSVVRSVLQEICSATQPAVDRKWMEVDNIKYLFHGSQPWTKSQANQFATAALNVIGSN